MRFDAGIVESCIPLTDPFEVTVVTTLHNPVAAALRRTSLPFIAPSCEIPISAMRGFPPISVDTLTVTPTRKANNITQ